MFWHVIVEGKDVLLIEQQAIKNYLIKVDLDSISATSMK